MSHHLPVVYRERRHVGKCQKRRRNIVADFYQLADHVFAEEHIVPRSAINRIPAQVTDKLVRADALIRVWVVDPWTGGWGSFFKRDIESSGSVEAIVLNHDRVCAGLQQLVVEPLGTAGAGGRGL